MYNKSLVYFIYIFYMITNVQIIYSYLLYTYDNITDFYNYSSITYTYDKSKVSNKTEILKVRNTFYNSFLYKK
jgi:hypothetical protein